MAADLTAGYTATTRALRVQVRSFYLADQSRPDENHYAWAYRVRIDNLGAEPVQLLRRTWIITDGLGRSQTIHGEGVIGQQPILDAGESFEYTSGTPLDTSSGFMRGAFHMIATGSGEAFDIEVPTFSLDSPFTGGRLH